jgi:succinyl-CoA synthetase alpha subunit
MFLKGAILKGRYYDSITLMSVAKELRNLEGVEEILIVMGTQQNKLILKSLDMYINEFDEARDNELLIAVKTSNEKLCDEVISKAQDLLSTRSLDSALKILPNSNIALISVPGQFAAYEAMNALRKGLHVMIFSDNVPFEKAYEIKKYGREKGLLVMGPGCGTAIINGAPLGFANVINRGDIGIVSSGGTGLQEVCCIITNMGGGISQAIGTGGDDVKKHFEGMSFITGLEALIEDNDTKVIVLISKPPDLEVLEKIGEVIKKSKKPIIGAFLGVEKEIIKNYGAIPAQNLEEAALLAISYSKGIPWSFFLEKIKETENMLMEKAKIVSKTFTDEQKFFRGLFQGGTLAYENQVILKNFVKTLYSNVPLKSNIKLENPWFSKEHTVIDFGDEFFTVGRLHPQLNYELRNQRILSEARDKSVAIIYLDIVIGFGTNPDPKSELLPVLLEIKKTSNVLIIITITGTDKDPQNKKDLIESFKNLGIEVFERNATASKFAGYILKFIGG